MAVDLTDKGVTVADKDIPTSVMANAVLFLRSKYRLPLGEIINDKFETEFKCVIYRNSYGGVERVRFKTAEDYLMFMVKFSEG